MRDLYRVRPFGIVGIVSGILWSVAALLQGGLSINESSGVLYGVDQALFWVAQIGWLVTVVGILRAQAAGDGRFGKVAPGLFALGLGLLVLAQPLGIATANSNLPLYPLGGMLSNVGGLLSGIAVVAAGRWRGWPRFALLVQAVCAFVVLFGAVLGGSETLSTLTLTLWGVAWAQLGLALVVSSGDERLRSLLPGPAAP